MKIDILVLEDWKPRVTWLREQFPNLAIYHVKYEDEFRDGLSLKPKMIILDHDLGLKTFDGTTAANILTTVIPPEDDTLILIWSQNPVGSQRMQSILRYGGYKAAVRPYGLANNSIKHTVRLNF